MWLRISTLAVVGFALANSSIKAQEMPVPHVNAAQGYTLPYQRGCSLKRICEWLTYRPLPAPVECQCPKASICVPDLYLYFFGEFGPRSPDLLHLSNGGGYPGMGPVNPGPVNSGPAAALDASSYQVPRTWGNMWNRIRYRNVSGEPIDAKSLTTSQATPVQASECCPAPSSGPIPLHAPMSTMWNRIRDKVAGKAPDSKPVTTTSPSPAQEVTANHAPAIVRVGNSVVVGTTPATSRQAAEQATSPVPAAAGASEIRFHESNDPQLVNMPPPALPNFGGE